MTRFRMFGIHLDQFAILADKNPNEKVGMKVGMNFRYADEGKKIACTANFEFSSDNEKLVVMAVTCDFVIQDDDFEKLKKDEKVAIPKDLLEFFAVHTIGTARGIMFCKTESTPFNNIIIPPINVNDMIATDLLINE